MRILFIAGNLTIGNDANINIAKIISNELISYGHEVYMLGKSSSTSNSQLQLSEKIHYRYIEMSEFLKDEYLISYLNKRLSFLKKVILKVPTINKYFKINEKQKYVFNAYVQEIEELCKAENIDVAISISFPYSTSLALASSNINSKKIVYQLDPHYSHYTNKSIRKKRKAFNDEVKVLNNVDAAIVTKLIFNENTENKLRPFLDKMYSMNFPNVRQVIKTNCSNTITFDKSYINCVFIGNLYKNIRNPDYLLQAFQKLQNVKIILYFIGGGDTNLLNKFKEELGSRLKIYGTIENEEAINVMLEADILVNIGNTISNQMPSKIFDYISTGKPILNFVKIDHCPTLEYTQQYPLCMEIFEDTYLTSLIVKNIENFCVENKGKQVDYSEIKKIYHDCTAKVVSKEFMDVINNVVEL